MAGVWKGIHRIGPTGSLQDILSADRPPESPGAEPGPLPESAKRVQVQRRRPRSLRSLNSLEVLALSRYRRLDPEADLDSGRTRVVCELCEAKVYVTIPALRRDAAARKGRPRELCGHAPAVEERPKVVANPATEENCLAELRKHEYEPVGEWPGAWAGDWHARCLMCGAEVWVLVSALTGRPVRKRCKHPLNKTIKPSDARRARAEAAKTNP